ncbi:MAG: hypothetical protein AAF532_13920 [Planctomycetota bacterium]
MPNPMTAAREALWDAIDNAADLSDTFGRKIKGAATEPPWNPLEAGLPDFPSIEIGPAGTSTASPYTEAKLDAPYPLEVVIFRPDYDLAFYEDVVAKIVLAAYRQGGSSGVPYVKDATGHPPELRNTSVRRLDRGDLHLMVIALRFDLRVRLDF